MEPICETEQQTKKKRHITEARRQQSREAQKRYREKQKRRLAELSILATASLASASQSSESSRRFALPSDLSHPPWPPTWNGDFDLMGGHGVADAQVEAADATESSELDSLMSIGRVLGDSGRTHDMSRPDILQLDEATLSSESMLGERSLACTAWTEHIVEDQEGQEFIQPPSLAQSSVLIGETSSSAVDAFPAPSIPRDTYIRVHRYSLLNSFMENAKVLGYTFDWVTTYGCHLSSLWCPALPQPPSQAGIRVHWKENIPAMMKVAPDLAPTAAQLQHPHLLYIDIFPFPEFREKMLALRAVRPKVFEEKDFMRDIDTGEAICCWGPTPWEKRSWEAQPWFLRKWWMLTGGEEGEMGSLSRWWRCFRGEEG